MFGRCAHLNGVQKKPYKNNDKKIMTGELLDIPFQTQYKERKTCIQLGQMT